MPACRQAGMRKETEMSKLISYTTIFPFSLSTIYPIAQSMLIQDLDLQPRGLGIIYLTIYAEKLQSIGVNHLALNLRFNTMNFDDTLERISKHVLPEFHSKKITNHE